MIRNGEIEPGVYRVTTHAGSVLDLQVMGVDRRDQGDYLIYAPTVPVNPDRAITVDSKLAVGDIRTITDDQGGVWRLNGETKIDSLEAVPVSEVTKLRGQHAARSPFSVPASGLVPPESNLRPQTADSDRAGILTGADIGQRPNAPENDDSEDDGDDADEPAVESDPKADAPAATGAALESSPQLAPEQADPAVDPPAANPKPEHLFEDQYQPVVPTRQTPDAHFGDAVTPEQAQAMEDQGMNPPPGSPEDPLTSADTNPTQTNEHNPVNTGPGDVATATETLIVTEDQTA